MMDRRKTTQIQTDLFKLIQSIDFYVDSVDADHDTARFQAKLI
jgi:hypothetical protein